MGLFQAVSGAIGGTLADQWLDFFGVPDGLPATAAAIGLVMVAQSGGRLLPFAPASAAATVAVLAAGFTGATGAHPDVGTLTAFVVGTSTLLTVAGVLLAAVISVWMYGGSVGSVPGPPYGDCPYCCPYGCCFPYGN